MTRVNNNDEDACRGESASDQAEAAALAAASELPGHDALVSERATTSGEEDWSGAGLRRLKMCPLCCAGPIFNENCADMSTHHGECMVKALGTHAGEVTECLPDGETFHASASDIAARVARVSSTKSVVDVTHSYATTVRALDPVDLPWASLSESLFAIFRLLDILLEICW